MGIHSRAVAARRLGTATLATAIAAAGLTGTAHAQSMPLEHPLTLLGGSGTTNFDARTGLFSISTTPVVLKLAPGADPCTIMPIGDPANKTVQLHVRLNDDGSIVSGISGDDFQMVGAADLDGDGQPDASGVLLRGEVIRFDWEDRQPAFVLREPGTGSADREVNGALGDESRMTRNLFAAAGMSDGYQIAVEVTGGALAGFFQDATIGLNIDSDRSTFQGDFTRSFSGSATGYQGVIDQAVLGGACCLPDGSCMVTSVLGCNLMGGTYLGDETQCSPDLLGDVGDYRLVNFPFGQLNPPDYGLRLDELFQVNVGVLDSFTFDFEHPGADMRASWDGETFRIHGLAFGGLDVGDAYDPNWTSWVNIDFTYTSIESVSGDDDLIVLGPPAQNFGSITWLETGEVIELSDFSNDNGFNFRFGDEDDDQGHLGAPGISGWGWMAYVGTDSPGTQDWRFQAIDICVDPEPQGACCLADGTCVVLTPSGCMAVGGTYQGDGVPCTDSVCVVPVLGACCLPDGTCVEATEEQCVGAGGLYQGDDVLCIDVDCTLTPVGACCLPDETCIVTTEDDCLAQGGDYAGDETTCADVDCVVSGACCLADGTCVITIEDDCLAMGGDFAGVGTDCDDVVCIPVPTGACCLADGTCMVLSADDCAAEGGDYAGDGSMCTPDVLGMPGSYRLRNFANGNEAPPGYGLRLDELFDATDGFDVFSFDFDGPMSNMRLDYDGTSVRIHGTAFGGRDTGIKYDPDFISAVEIDLTYDVVVSAPGDDDLIVLTPNGSNVGTMTWLATGQVFDLSDKMNAEEFTFRLGDEDDDAGHNGVPGITGWGWMFVDGGDEPGAQDWLFSAVDICAPDPMAGACCLPDETCIVTTEDQCIALCGLYAGDGTECGDVDCSIMLMGACCLPDGTCVELSSIDCDEEGGAYAGDGTFCTPDHLNQPGTYRLASHPFSPDWGLRLDELFDVTPDNDVFTFDFDADGANMMLTYDGATIRITGTAFGGRRSGGGYDPAWTSLVAVDFIYDMVHVANGDDDLIVTTEGMTNAGSLTWLATGEVFDLTDKSNGSFAFRFGDQDDDGGHQGWPGISGWGWLLYGNDPDRGTWKDWRFIALPICEPDAAAGLVAHWPLNEQTGQVATDIVGGIGLRMHGPDSDVDWYTSGYGTGVDFNQSPDSGDAMLRTDSTGDGAALRSALQSTNAITLQLFYQQDGAHANGSRIFSWSHGTNVDDRNVSMLGRFGSESEMYDNQTRLRTTDGMFNDGPDDVSDDQADDDPSVVTMTYDAAAGNELRIYVNGELWFVDSSPKGTFANWQDFHILIGNESSEDRPFEGEIYDIKIWNVALSAAQVVDAADALLDGDDDD
ncbi:MAG: LamG-like jellyroll fold domain-containing protein [Phycisphaerales bacterium]